MILQSDFIVSHLMLCIIAISTKNDSKKISSFIKKSYKNIFYLLITFEKSKKWTKNISIKPFNIHSINSFSLIFCNIRNCENYTFFVYMYHAYIMCFVIDWFYLENVQFDNVTLCFKWWEDFKFIVQCITNHRVSKTFLYQIKALKKL